MIWAFIIRYLLILDILSMSYWGKYSRDILSVQDNFDKGLILDNLTGILAINWNDCYLPD